MSGRRRHDTGAFLADLSTARRTPSRGPRAWLRRGLALAVVVTALWAIYQLAVTDGLTEEQLQAWVSGFGMWGPLVFLLVFTTLGSLVIPTTALTMVGATLFGPGAGFAYSLFGAFCAAMLGFSAARTLGRGAVTRFLERRGGRAAALDQRLARQGFATAFFMRLLYLPNGLINVVCGVSAIPGRVYAAATLLGLAPMVFAVAVITGGARHALLDGDTRALLEPEVLLSAALFLLCIAIPLVNLAIQRRRRRSTSG